MRVIAVVLVAALGLHLAAPRGITAETNSTSGESGKGDETNTSEFLRTFLQLQEQMHATRLALEQTRKENEQASMRTWEVLSARLQAIENALVSQRNREFESMRGANWVLLLLAGTLAVAGFGAMLLMAYFQWRTVNGLAAISTVLPTRGLSPRALLAGVPVVEPEPPSAGPVAQSSSRLLGALEQLERRLFSLERHAQPALNQGTPEPKGGPTPMAHTNGNGHEADAASPAPDETPEQARVRKLLAAGQELLDEDKVDHALAAFEQVLASDPRHAEALVKKGNALERLQKLDAAVACYDAAIAADSSLTIAYLHKGGLFNRMEKFGEALECYEMALRTQEIRGG
jgi:tetratricopeptide (TPR) repeat protein